MALLLAAMAMVPMVSAYQASSYGPLYSNLDTAAVAQNAQGELSSMGYASTAYTGSPGASNALTRMSSDNVFFFDGHGGAGLLEFPDSFITGKDTGIYPHLQSSNGQLADVVLAVYMACNTAVLSDTYGNVAYQSLVEGVDMSVGWTGTINSAQSEYWSQRFWYWLDERCSVKIAAQRATSDLGDLYGTGNLGGMNNYVCRSNGNCAMTIDPARAGD